MANISLVSGKGEFVTRRNPENGLVERVCLCTYNVDFSIGGCMAQVPGELVADVIRMNGSYGRTKEEVEKNVKEYRARGLNLDCRCDYCYAKGTGRGNWGKTTSRGLNGSTRKTFEEIRPEFVRLGKSTECGHPMYIPVLKQFLELCNDFKTKVIFPTKMLAYDSEIAELLKQNQGLLSYSMGFDKLEGGVVSQGFSNDWRINTALDYFNYGTNCVLTCVADVTQSIQDNIYHGSSLGEALNANKYFKIPFRIIPMRLVSKDLAIEVTGKKWEDLVMPSNDNPDHPELNLQTEKTWRYNLKGNNEAVPLFFHSDFQELCNQGKGFCGRIGDYEYCDKCDLEDNTRIKFPIAEIVPVIYDRDNNGRNSRRRAMTRPKKDTSPTFL